MELTIEELIERAAETAHEVNRRYCAGVGDFSQVPWRDAPKWQQDSAIAGAKAIYDNPGTTPEQSHECWLAQKVADGWVYGIVKNAELKTHPCMVPYSELTNEHKVKDTLFGAVVRGVLGLPVP
jgi:hypothetical protein